MSEMDSPLMALSPLDGRYRSKMNDLVSYFSEFGLISYRILVELQWLQHLAGHPEIQELSPFSDEQLQKLFELRKNFDLKDAQRVKEIELITNHDVKAVEYFIKEKLASDADLKPRLEFVHFACTSEDINNLAYSLMVKDALSEVLLPSMQQVSVAIRDKAWSYAEQPMLSRTHGQPASPTTMGKEFANVNYRLMQQLKGVSSLPMTGKFNGAVGNFNAHYAAYPEVDWPQVASSFVTSLGLEWHPFTTQIEPHDRLAELCHNISRFNTVLIDFSRDIWAYVALDYFRQKPVSGEVGSSTMPHKVNPIDFENAEGNLGLANAVLGHLADKLPISRWQRDLTDSTVLRNLGSGLGYTFLACQSLLKGLDRLELNSEAIDTEINHCWEVLAEPVQTVMRRYGIEQPYEKLKALSRGRSITQEDLRQFIQGLDLPTSIRKQLLALTPRRYLGNASIQAKATENTSGR